MGRDCKHIAATLVHLLDRSQIESGIEAFSMSLTDRASKSEVANPVVEAWLEKLRRAAAPPLTVDAAGTDFVAYVFGTPATEPAGGSVLPFEVVIVRRVRSGALARVRECNVKTLVAATAEAVTGDDAAIGRLIVMLGTSNADHARLVTEIVHRAVETGRAYGSSSFEEPLRVGEPRAGHVVWELAGDGRQRPTLLVDGSSASILPGRVPLYMDLDDRSVGAIETGIPARALAVLLSAPPLSAADVSVVASALAKTVPHLQVPAPLALTETVRRIAPVPMLALRTISLPVSKRSSWNAWAEPEVLDIAILTFAYGDVVVDPNDRIDEIRIVRGTETIVHPRSIEDERRLAARLIPLGFYSDSDARSRARSTGLFLRFNDPENAWPGFVHREMPSLRAEGWKVVVDPDFRYQVVDAMADDSWHPDVAERAGGWFDLSIGLDLDGRRIELLPMLSDLVAQGAFAHLVAGEDAPSTQDDVMYVKLPDGLRVAFPRERVRAIVRTLIELGDAGSLGEGGTVALSRANAGVLDTLEAKAGLRWNAPERLRDLSRRLRDFSGIERFEVPTSFLGELRPYQRDGLDWLQFLRSFGFGGVLADDMGLGKSVQTIAHILCEKEAGRLKKPALLVVPTSLVFNWCAEFARFAPSLRTLTLHGVDRSARFGDIETSDVVITTYALLVRDDVFAENTWHLVVLDEAQFLKNPQSKAAQVARALRCEHRVCLTGTPVENHLGDLWSLFAIALPGLLGDRSSFGRIFRTPIEKRGDLERRRALAERTRPFLLRRTKENVASELPEKTEIVRRVELSGAQRDLYETVRIAMHERVQQEIERSGIARSQIVILDALLKLRQVCCDPRLLPERFARSASSIKLDLLVEIVPEMIEEGRRILLFSQFTSMLDLIVPELEKLAIPYAMLTGKTTDRAAQVQRFESGDVPLFLISLKAGGTGLNLTSADTVIHYDPWWNPAVERQATDRAHRIGQTKRVFVYKLIGAETVEEKILDLQTRKAQLAAAIFSEKADTSATFAREDIERLFSPLS
jgi:superfamily II DNA or RNA helicase